MGDLSPAARFTGCFSQGDNVEEAIENIKKAIEMHVQGLIEDNLPIPESESFAEYVTIAEKSSTSSEVV